MGVGGTAQGEFLKDTNWKKEQPKEEGGKQDLEARGMALPAVMEAENL